MNVKLINSAGNGHTVYGNVARVTFSEVKQKNGDVIPYAEIWAFGDPVTGFITYNLWGDEDKGDKKTSAVYILNEDGKTVDTYYPIHK